MKDCRGLLALLPFQRNKRKYTSQTECAGVAANAKTRFFVHSSTFHLQLPAQCGAHWLLFDYFQWWDCVVDPNSQECQVCCACIHLPTHRQAPTHI